MSGDERWWLIGRDCLSEHYHKQVFDRSVSSIFRDSLSSLAYQGGRRLSTGFEALTTGCLADYWKVRGRDKSLFLEFMASNV